MSTKIGLEFSTKIDFDLFPYGVSVRLIRLLTTIKLKTERGWTREFKAIVDTGNPISVIPFSIWNKAEVRPILPFKVKLYGFGTNDKSAILGRLAEVALVFLDKEGISSALRLKAYILEDDRAPFLIGFEDVLTEIKLVSDYKRKSAWLAFA